jgi:hypothetical protein
MPLRSPGENRGGEVKEKQSGLRALSVVQGQVGLRRSTRAAQRPWEEQAQIVADTLGLVPGLNVPAEILSGALSLYRGDVVGFSLSMIGRLPIAGEVAIGVKIARSARELWRPAPPRPTPRAAAAPASVKAVARNSRVRRLAGRQLDSRALRAVNGSLSRPVRESTTLPPLPKRSQPLKRSPQPRQERASVA